MEIASEMKTRRMTCEVELGKLIQICLVETFVTEKSSSSNLRSSRKSEKKWWFRKLCSLSCVMEEKQMQIEGSDSLLGKKSPQRMKCSKKHKEMSVVYLSQDFQAHEGPILVMKFNPDGEFLASAEEDRIVWVWKVVVYERSNDIDIPDTDPLSLYFTLNHQLKLQPFYAKKERTGKVKRWSRTSDSACVVLPPKVFRLLEQPLCEFKGHRGEILDLSWSNSNCLLSSSVNKTFNPIDDNYFISGSLDGKVWIWEISNCHVVSWSDIKDIVIVGCLLGSITGFCCFYNTSNNQLLLDGQICLRSKKKSSGKRIISFQVFIGCRYTIIVSVSPFP
ncbi:LOW QUALITY PROTEIN: hypothetical protein V2J09_011086 [Rumex salicifolius]